MKITKKPRTENYTSENIDLFVQKNSEADSRLIDYQDNTPAHIILKTDDLIWEKTKNQTNLDVGLSGFIRPLTWASQAGQFQQSQNYRINCWEPGFDSLNADPRASPSWTKLLFPILVQTLDSWSPALP